MSPVVSDSEKKEVVVIGAGGHCLAVVDTLENLQEYYRIKGILAYPEIHNDKVSGYPVLGHLSEALENIQRWPLFINGIGFMGDNNLHREVFEQVKSQGGQFESLVSPSAVVSSSATIQEGSVILNHTVIGASAIIGQNTIINNGAVVDHGSVVGDHCHVATAAVVNGNCRVENECFLGSNSTVIQGVRVREKCLIGAGAVILKDTMAAQKYVGVPGRPLK